MQKPTPILLAILDGWGAGPLTESNAIYIAETPNMDRWQKNYPYTTLVAHNGAVGLPEGQMGNSEVGHLNIGAGRIVYQDFTRINRAIETGDFSRNEVLKKTFTQALEKKSALHLMGLVSDGGVHSHMNHLLALLKMAADHGLTEVYIHAFMDGRDTPPTSGLEYINQLQHELVWIGTGRLATISGRFYAMDRDKRWERIKIAWQAIVDGQGILGRDPVQAVKDAYHRGETDEFIRPTVLLDERGTPVAKIKDNDMVLVFNFRADRVRELTHAFTDKTWDAFAVNSRPALENYVTFTQYDKQFNLPVIFPPASLDHILAEELSSFGLKQLRIAETEKYAHVTYFFNGGREDPFPLEDRVLIPSPKEVATYDMKPEMSAYLVTEKLLQQMDGEDYSLIVLNFANGDMVGHSGILSAAVKACEAVDVCLGRIVEKFTAKGGIVIITADHGNAEMMREPDSDRPVTAHSSNPVPFILISEQHKSCTLRQGGSLRDIAPTILSLQNLPVPKEMTGRCLIVD
ncbi:MAG: 2,3-bisphosphoglycerate-independent phosphoglycerate mutase [Deltaproteobacteria bacterium]|jgi:2,3-bisphosphoglycerate-independent phosphoglycerate mutase|nr:2,3-bisphosphoglycerate-independent phosphoglycerate mutase [Deltaproteobacteria bacterium]